MVAQVEELVEREALLADGVQADIDLQALAALLQGGEAGLALGANGHDAPGDGYRHAIGFQILGRRFAPLGAHLGDGVRGRELVGIGRLAQLLDFFQLFLAQIEEVVLKFRIEHDDSFMCELRTQLQSQYIVQRDSRASSMVRPPRSG